MSKRVLAIVLAFALVFSSFTTAFADTTISQEAAAAAELGMLVGNGDGVTSDYLTTTPNRLQSAIMFLRLKGLEAEAKAYAGTDNFADAANYAWAEGKAIMGYLKANTELGWIGSEGNFKPGEQIDEQSYYKVMLEALGYKQTVGEVAGDFTWNTVIEFAKSKGLTPAGGTFNVDGIAKATIGALKAVGKDNNKLIDKLVEAGKIDADKAEALGLYVKEQRPAVEDKIAPKVSKVESTDSNQVEITFDRPIEKASAQNLSNYVIKKGTTLLAVKAAEVSGKKVVLTTEGMENNRTYTISIEGVKNASGVVMTSKYTKTFQGTIDNKAPELVNVENKNNIRLQVIFNEELDKESAETVANYTITGKTPLEVLSARLMKDADGDYTTVELITSAQKSGKYTLSVVNVADDSVSVNKITKADTDDFYGKTAETTAPKLDTTVKATSSTKVIVSYKDENRIDFASATDVGNYTFNNDLVVESAEMEDAEDLDCKTVILTTSTQEENKSYTLTIRNIADELGNTVDSKLGLKASIKGLSDDLTAPVVTGVKVKDADELSIFFNERLDKASAENVENYDFGTLGIEKLALESDRQTVKVTTAVEMDNVSYTVKVKGIKDINGNEMAANGADAEIINFVGFFDKDNLDKDAPEVEYVDVVSTTEVQIGFDEKVKVVGGHTAADLNPSAAGTGVTVVTLVELDQDGKETATTVDAKFVGGYYESGVGVGGYSENGTVLELKVAQNSLALDKIYKVKTVANIVDMAGNSFDASLLEDTDFEVSGSTAYSDRAEVVSIDQTRQDRIQVTFTKAVWVDAAKLATQNLGAFTVATKAGDAKIVTLTSKTNTVLPEQTYKFNFSEFLVDMQGIPAVDENDEWENYSISKDGVTEFETFIVDEDAPNVEDIITVNNRSIKVIFDENVMDTTGRYVLTWKDEDDKSFTATLAVDTFNSKDNVIFLVVPADKALKSEYDYTLEVSGVKDTGNNAMKTKQELGVAGVDNAAPAKFISGVQVINGTTVYVNVNEAYRALNNTDGIVIDKIVDTSVTPAKEYAVNIALGDDTLENGDFIFNVAGELANLPAFYAGGVFEFKSGATTLYTFTSNLDDNSIELENDEITFEAAEEGVVVNVYNAADNTVIETITLGENDAAAKITKTTELNAAENVIITIVKNGNVIAAKKVAVVVAE